MIPIKKNFPIVIRIILKKYFSITIMQYNKMKLWWNNGGMMVWWC